MRKRLSKLLTGLALLSVACVLSGRQAGAYDAPGLYEGRTYTLNPGESSWLGKYWKKPAQFAVGFWTEAGIYTNSHGTDLMRSGFGYLPQERFYPASGNGYFLGNLQNPDFNMNQAGIFLEKRMDTCHGFDWGFKAQLLYGTDAYLTQSREDFSFDDDWRDGDYYTSISDVYLTAGYRKLGVKIGKFASPLSYEYNEAPNNFFYSHSYGYLTSPDTNAGALFEYRHSCRISLYGGWTAGNDAGWSNRFGDSAFLGGVKSKLWKGANLSYMLQWGRFYGGEYDNMYRYTKMLNDYLADGENFDAYYHSLVFSQCYRKWNYAAEWYLMNASNYSDDLVVYKRGDDASGRYGICQYLTYQVGCKLAVGARAEWMHISDWDYNGYEVTLGVNWTPVRSLVVRPEIRYDWCYGGINPYNNGRNSEQFSGGCAVMYQF